MILMDFSIALFFGITVGLLLGYITFSINRTESMRKPRTRRLRKIENHLPDFLDSISSSLEIGNSLQQSIEIAVKNDRTPLGAYFKKILLKVKSGMTLDVSLEQQAQEIDGGSLSLALLSMASSYRSGGNLIESLSLLATVCRERQILRKKILARTAQSRTQGYVLIFVPIFFMLLLYFVSPHNMIPVLKTSAGRLILISAVILQLTGGLIIKGMLKQDII